MKQISFLLVSVLVAQFAAASYEETSRRYLTNHEILQALESIVPLQSCSAESLAKEGSSLGENSPLTGQPISPTPGQSTVALITRCLTDAFKPRSRNDEKMVSLYGKENFEAMEKEKNHLGLWTKFSEQTQKNFIATMVYNILGSDETIKDFDIIEPDILRTKLYEALKTQNNFSTMDAIKFITLNLVLSDEFLSY